MPNLTSFRDVIELWGTSHGSRIAMAADLSGACTFAPQISAAQVSKWWQRRSIPAEYWAGLLTTERAREAGLTADLLTGLAAREPAEARA